MKVKHLAYGLYNVETGQVEQITHTESGAQSWERMRDNDREFSDTYRIVPLEYEVLVDDVNDVPRVAELYRLYFR